MMDCRLLKRIYSCLWVLPIMMTGPLVADETDIFFQNLSSQVNANVLFMMDVSGSMDIELDNGETRMEVLQRSFREAMEQAPEAINIGIMHYGNATPVQVGLSGLGISRYDWSSIKGISFPVKPLDELVGGVSVRDYLPDFVDGWRPKPGGYTPIVDSIYEAVRYFRGEEVVFGKALPEYDWAAHPDSYTGSLTCDSFSGTDGGCFIDDEKETSCGTIDTSTCGPRLFSNVLKGCGRYFPNGACAEWIREDEIYEHCQHKMCESYRGRLTYKSPIEHSCQANYLVIMSDGGPEYPHFNEARNFRGFHRYPQSVYPGRIYGRNRLQPLLDSNAVGGGLGQLIDTNQCQDSPQGFSSATCGPEFVRFLADEDQIDSKPGDQNILTYTVSYGLGDSDNDRKGTYLLKQLATAQDGFFEADDADGLIRAFKQILVGAKKNSFAFSSPTFESDKNNALSHGKYAYMPVFDSNIVAPLWPGNLRKFKVNDDGVIVNSNGQPALDEKGMFTSSASDIWSNNTAHGVDVRLGGAASQIPSPNERYLLTDAQNNNLSALTVNNASITASMFKTSPNASGTVSADYRAKLINFIRGYKDGVSFDYNADANTDGLFRQHMGDMLNSQPVTVRYANQSLVFAATNEGFLHAFDTETGEEVWAFMPSDLLRNQDIFLRNDFTEDNKHIYGIDGSLLLRRSDENQDGIVQVGEKAHLYFGLRRGGRMYYALDISNPILPKIKWKIGPNSGSTALSDLGEAWSRPTFSRLRKNNSADESELRSVLVFGGGYDTRKDEENVAARLPDQWGKNVYIVDAEDGSLVWSLSEVSGSSQVKHSIPGDIRILDMDKDGGLDRLYFSDTGGNVWRVDMFGKEVSGSDERVAQLTHLASLGTADGRTTGSNPHRMFFYEPDAALRLDKGKPVLTLALGSGYRTQPLNNDVEDRFYVIQDPHVYDVPPNNFETITEQNLLSSAALRAGSESFLAYPNKKGWYYPFSARAAEKVLASSITFLDKVLFTTFATVDANGNLSEPQACDPAVNTSRAYVLDLMSGRPVADLNRDDQGLDDFVVAGVNEFLGTPQLIFSSVTGSEGGDCTAGGNCQQHVKIRVGKMQQPLLDTNNSKSLANAETLRETVDISDLIMRMYWFHGKLPEDAGTAAP